MCQGPSRMPKTWYLVFGIACAKGGQRFQASTGHSTGSKFAQGCRVPWSRQQQQNMVSRDFRLRGHETDNEKSKAAAGRSATESLRANTGSDSSSLSLA